MVEPRKASADSGVLAKSPELEARSFIERPQSIEQAVLRALRNMIATGALTPGQPIRQDEIAAGLGVSRVPVRESLKVLEGEGHVEHIPRQGFQVVDLKISDLYDIYRMRELLEAEALTHGVPLLTDADLAIVRTAMLELESDANVDIMRTIDANTRFHLTPIDACNKQLLSRSIRILWEAATPFAIRLILSTESGLIHSEHALMYEALESRDTAAVISAFTDHREASLKRIRKVFESYPHGLDPATA